MWSGGRRCSLNTADSFQTTPRIIQTSLRQKIPQTGRRTRIGPVTHPGADRRIRGCGRFKQLADGAAFPRWGAAADTGAVTGLWLQVSRVTRRQQQQIPAPC
ncbi:unnamed protein product [Pleuronectes platessa]|uniref:Uncharacterized protein n=1 Tax=Pleuronectes platessa TaxID=8262 RepID=A0A9N7TTZ5_PLEPL|nr:unnamed protein product [Pleuronectes platessa]